MSMSARKRGCFPPGVLPPGNSQAVPVGFRPFGLVAEAGWGPVGGDTGFCEQGWAGLDLVFCRAVGALHTCVCVCVCAWQEAGAVPVPWSCREGRLTACARERSRSWY